MTISRKRLKIIRGEDLSPIFNLRDANGKIFDLTGATNITAKFKKTDRTNLLLDMTSRPATKAAIEHDGVTFTADTAGAVGNSIILVFDGIDDIDTVVAAWNTPNPSNTVSFSGGSGTDVLAAGTIKLTNGFEAFTPITILEAKAGQIKITLIDLDTSQLRIGPNQDINFSIDFGAPPTGTRRKGRLTQRLDVIDD